MSPIVSFLITLVVSDGDNLFLQRHAVSFDKDEKQFHEETHLYWREIEHFRFWLSVLPEAREPGNEILDIKQIDSARQVA